MITFELHVESETIGRKLAHDAEEAAFAFVTMIEDAPDDFPKEVADYAGHNAEEIAQFFEMMAKRIRERDNEE